MTSREVANDAIRRFIEQRERFEQAGAEVVRVVGELLGEAGIHATISCRVKDVESFRGKIALRTDYTDPWTQITDKVGARAIVSRAGDVDRIHELIVSDDRLKIWDVTDKRSHLGHDELGYSGLHLDLYAPHHPGDTERITCELQIRTIAQDAWSVVSHTLIYKAPIELPLKDKRAIMRLVALVEVFDEEVQRVMDQQAIAAADGGEPAADLVNIVTAQYARFERNTGNLGLTRAVLHAVRTALAEQSTDEYRTTLSAYVQEHRATLEQLYADYGAGSQMSTSSDYVLWSQPESIALLECLDSRPHVLLQAWRDHELPEAWLKPLAAHTDAQLDL